MKFQNKVCRDVLAEYRALANQVKNPGSNPSGETIQNLINDFSAFAKKAHKATNSLPAESAAAFCAAMVNEAAKVYFAFEFYKDEQQPSDLAEAKELIKNFA